MLSNKPYLVRAFYDWIVDSQCTPLLIVNATLPRCNVPQEYVENGEIVLNIAPAAVRDLKVSRHLVECKASFSGIAHLISVPMRAVLAVYAEENGQGMFFDIMDEEEDETEETLLPVAKAISKKSESHSDSDKSKESRKSHLTLVE